MNQPQANNDDTLDANGRPTAVVAMLGCIDEISELSQGDPAVTDAITRVMRDYSHHDPQALFGAFHVTMFLKDQGLHGKFITKLFKETCNSSVVNFIVVMRMSQYGLLPAGAMSKIKRGEAPELDFPALTNKLCEILPTFKRT